MTEKHGATITSKSATDLHAICRCGWIGENVYHPDYVLAGLTHLAMADWAAHVHVAEGLAVEE